MFKRIKFDGCGEPDCCPQSTSKKARTFMLRKQKKMLSIWNPLVSRWIR